MPALNSVQLCMAFILLMNQSTNIPWTVAKIHYESLHLSSPTLYVRVRVLILPPQSPRRVL